MRRMQKDSVSESFVPCTTLTVDESARDQDFFPFPFEILAACYFPALDLWPNHANLCDWLMALKMRIVH